MSSDVIVIESSEAIVVTQLAVGPQGPPGVGAALPIRMEIPSGETVAIQELEASEVRAVKWIITLTNPVAEIFRTFELLALNHNTHCSHTIYGIMGGNLQCDTEVQLINNKITLKVTNSELSNLIVDAIHICSIKI